MMMCEGVSRTMLVSTEDEHQTSCKRYVLKCTIENTVSENVWILEWYWFVNTREGRMKRDRND